jgi:hypothetical protein
MYRRPIYGPGIGYGGGWGGGGCCLMSMLMMLASFGLGGALIAKVIRNLTK